MTKLATIKSKKAVEPEKANSEILTSTKKRSNFLLVNGGRCPHCDSRLEDEIPSSGIGVTSECSKCHHRWYYYQRGEARGCKCLTCSADTRKRSAGTRKRVADVLNEADVKTNSNLDTVNARLYNNSVRAGMAELADAADLKSAGEILVGSSPSPGTSTNP